MQRMNGAIFDGSGRCDKRLASNLTSKNSLQSFVRALAAKNVLFDRLEIEKPYEIVHRRLSHPHIVATSDPRVASRDR